MRMTDEIGKEIMFDTTEDKGRRICPRDMAGHDKAGLSSLCEALLRRIEWRRMHRMDVDDDMTDGSYMKKQAMSSYLTSWYGGSMRYPEVVLCAPSHYQAYTQKNIENNIPSISHTSTVGSFLSPIGINFYNKIIAFIYF